MEGFVRDQSWIIAAGPSWGKVRLSAGGSFLGLIWYEEHQRSEGGAATKKIERLSALACDAGEPTCWPGLARNPPGFGSKHDVAARDLPLHYTNAPPLKGSLHVFEGINCGRIDPGRVHRLVETVAAREHTRSPICTNIYGYDGFPSLFFFTKYISIIIYL